VAAVDWFWGSALGWRERPWDGLADWNWARASRTPADDWRVHGPHSFGNLKVIKFIDIIFKVYNRK